MFTLNLEPFTEKKPTGGIIDERVLTRFLSPGFVRQRRFQGKWSLTTASPYARRREVSLGLGLLKNPISRYGNSFWHNSISRFGRFARKMREPWLINAKRLNIRRNISLYCSLTGISTVTSFVPHKRPRERRHLISEAVYNANSPFSNF